MAFRPAGGRVLSLNFDDIWQVMTDQGLGVLLRYQPADYPDAMRHANPYGELDAKFIFQRCDEDVRQLVLGRADGVVQLCVRPGRSSPEGTGSRTAVDAFQAGRLAGRLLDQVGTVGQRVTVHLYGGQRHFDQGGPDFGWEA